MIRRFLYVGLLISVLFSQQYKIDHMEGTFDLDGDGFMEFASLESKINGDKKLSVVRYYELDDNGYQTLEWELESPDGLLSNFVDVELGDLDGDGVPELITVSNMGDPDKKELLQPIAFYYYWDGERFSEEAGSVFNLSGGRDFVLGHNFVLMDYDGDMDQEVAVSLGSPLREIVILDLNKDSNIIFEGAQGTMLDIDHGTYPYVTSSNTTLPGLITGTGIGVDKVDYSLGITKAYTTRVGHGPFPTELHDQLGLDIAKWGGEVGATTGRARRCGWLDLKILRQSIELNRIDGIALTKLDVLDNLEKIKICVDYGDIDYESFEASDMEYLEIDGWMSSTVGITDYDKLPDNAKKYIKTIEEISKTRIVMISTGPSRDQIIILEDIFT